MEEPLRILCVFACLDRGGAETMCMELYRNMDKEKIQFDFVKHTSNIGQYENEITDLGGRIFEAPKFSGYNLISYANWWKKHFLLHPEHKIVHGHYFTISYIYFLIAKHMNRLTIAHSHSSGIKTASLKYWLAEKFVKMVECVADYRFACSEQAGKWMYPHKDFYILHNAIDLEKFSFSLEKRVAIRHMFHLKDELVLGSVGNFTNAKNPLGLVDVFCEISKIYSNAKLLWVGDGPLRKEAEKKVEEIGLSKTVIFTGVRSDVDQLMQAMDVFLLPSLWEGLPVVTVEAQAAGLPCLISDAVSREAAITDLCAFLPHSNPALWADAIRNLNLVRRDTREEIRRSGYDIRTTAKWLEEFYVNL